MDVRENQHAPYIRAHHRANRIESLREVQTLVGAAGRPHDGNERIRGSLEEGESAGDHVERDQEAVVLARLCGGQNSSAPAP
jgi:hypothetical protein